MVALNCRFLMKVLCIHPASPQDENSQRMGLGVARGEKHEFRVDAALLHSNRAATRRGRSRTCPLHNWPGGRANGSWHEKRSILDGWESLLLIGSETGPQHKRAVKAHAKPSISTNRFIFDFSARPQSVPLRSSTAGSS